MRYEFHPDAVDEYMAAIAHYAKIDTRLALQFARAVEGAVDRIVESPDRWRAIDDDVRRCLTRIFPYGVLYTV